MKFEEIFKRDYYQGYDINKNDFVPQKRVYELFNNKKILKILNDLNIYIPKVSEVTFRNRVNELIKKGKVRSQKLRNMNLININDIPTIIDYLVKRHKNLIKCSKKNINKNINKNIMVDINKSIKDINKTYSNESKELSVKAKKGDKKAINKLEKKFKCKTYTSEELKNFQLDLNKNR